jgi:hypothetical protein
MGYGENVGIQFHSLRQRPNALYSPEPGATPFRPVIGVALERGLWTSPAAAA